MDSHSTLTDVPAARTAHRWRKHTLPSTDTEKPSTEQQIQVHSPDRTQELEQKVERIPHVYYEDCQRTLSTLIMAGTFMASVEASLLSFSLGLTEEHQRLKSASICFEITGLFSTSFCALYAAATFIWLKEEWKPGPKRFEEWVAGSVVMMIRWSSTFLVAGIYAGFVGLVIVLFAVTPLSVAIFATASLLFFGLGPMSWGLYFWLGLYRGVLTWQPSEEGSLPHHRRSTV